ncbi:MAG: hypothetical protein KQI35_09240 [Bacteroidetes bacterium]|nr:hypothetical protein [Bacteroidota bacterium]
MKIFLSIGQFLMCLVFFQLNFSPSAAAQKQQSGFWKDWSINAGGGPNLFYGDTDNYRFYRVFRNNSEWRFGYSLMAQKKISPLFIVRGQFMQGQLSGTKRKDAIWFEGNVIETSLSVRLELLNLLWGNEERKISVYAMGGIGFSHWKAELKNRFTNEVIQGNGHKTGSGLFGRTLEPVLPFGMGVDYRFNKHWSVNFEGTLRPVNSDKLDANEGGFKFDFYSYNFVGVTYYFIKREKKKPMIPPREIVYEKPDDFPEPNFKPAKKVVPVKPNLTLEDQLLAAELESGLYDSPWPGVEFRVQVSASRTESDPDKIKAKLKLPGELKMNEGNGWYRYSTGEFIKYWKAKEYRNILVSRYNVKDAFVVAYRDGERINLSELINSLAVASEGELIVENKRPVIDRAFSVQLLASADGNISTRVIREMFEIEEEVYKEYKNGLYLYTVGNFDSYDDALSIRDKMINRGVTGAFVVGYKDGIRIKDIQEILD